MNYTDLLGKPYKHGGRGVGGYDCYGLVIEIYKRLGLEVPLLNSPEADLRHDFYIGLSVQFIKLEKPEPNCMVALQIKPGIVSHVGVVLPDCIRFIHILQSCSVVIEKLSNPRWHRRIAGYYKCK